MLKLVWERWKKVPELKNVKVSSLGRVKINGKTSRTFWLNSYGYYASEFVLNNDDITWTNADELKMYMDKYLSNSNPQQSIAPFIYSDVKVVALFRKDLLLKSGIFLNIEIK